MRSDYKQAFNPSENTPFNPIRLRIKIISARQLPKSPSRKKNEICSPVVKLYVRGFVCDKASQSTHVISGNGFNPCWNCDVQFNIFMPEIAVLLFTISDSVTTIGSKVIAYYSIPISCIRTGYRIVPLFSSLGKQIPMSDLFCKFSIEHL